MTLSIQTQRLSNPQVFTNKNEAPEVFSSPKPLTLNPLPPSFRSESRNWIPTLFSPQYSRKAELGNSGNGSGPASPVSPSVLEYYNQTREALKAQIQEQRHSENEYRLLRHLEVLDNCFSYASAFSWNVDQMRRAFEAIPLPSTGSLSQAPFHELLLANAAAEAPRTFLQNIQQQFRILFCSQSSREEVNQFFDNVLRDSPLRLDARTIQEFRSICARSRGDLLLRGTTFLAHAMTHELLSYPATQKVQEYLNIIYSRHARAPQFPLLLLPIVSLEQGPLARICGRPGNSQSNFDACSNPYDPPHERIIFVSEPRNFGITYPYQTLVHEYFHHYAAMSREQISESNGRNSDRIPIWLEEGMTQFSVHQLDADMRIDTDRGTAISFLLQHYPEPAVLQTALEELYFFGNAQPLRELLGPPLFRIVMQ